MKRYATVKIKDPTTDGHSIRLMPCQSLEVVCTKQNPDDDFNVCILGGFLVLTNVLVEDTRVVFSICQKHDMTEWSKISTIFVGNVVVCGKKDKVRLCVTCISTNEMKSNVLTVVNPDDQLVKMEPHQLLQIVVFDEQGRWNIDGLLGITCVRSETVVNDFPKIYDHEILFCQEPRSVKLPINPFLLSHPPEYFQNEIIGGGLVTEYHFWCCLSIAEIRKLNNACNGSYPLGTVELKVEYEDHCGIKRMDLMLGVRGSKKQNSFDYYRAIHALSQSWHDRSLSYSRHALLNPTQYENIDVSDALDGWFYLEIPAPCVYYTNFDDASAWMVCEEDAESPIFCHELKSRYVDGKCVQRFLINNISIKCAEEFANLGKIRFVAEDDNNIKDIIINFWSLPGEVVQKPEIRRQGAKLLTCTYDVDMELLSTKDLTESATVVLLSDIDVRDVIDYSEYFSDNYLESLGLGIKKKWLHLSHTNMMLIPSAANIGS
jgi:hypothetical protein